MSSNKDTEATAKQLATQLNEAAAEGKPKKGIAQVLQRIKNELVWTKQLHESESGGMLEYAIRTCTSAPERSGDEELTALVQATLQTLYAQVREDDIRAAETRWWHTEPVPEGAGRIMLEFRDVTADHKTWSVKELWPPETVEAAPSETFERVAQRFRVQANKKHRHPFLPCMHFDAVLKTGSTAFESLDGRELAQVLDDLAEENIVPYVRNDEDNNSEYLISPARHFSLWERTLPPWCVTPDHWIEPIPPPGFVEHPEAPPTLKEQYYKKVPTLNVYGSGRYIVPSAKKPDIISRALFVPVQDYGPNTTSIVALDHEADLVPRGEHLVPGKITLDAARALLGRVVQSSTEPRPDSDAPPAGKRRKVNKFAAQSLGFAWGLETTPEGEPSWLHCISYSLNPSGEYVLDLTGQGRDYDDWRSPIALRTIRCAWVGTAVLPADVKVMGGGAESGSTTTSGPPAGSTSSVGTGHRGLTFKQWSKKTKNWIRALNQKRKAPVVEVGPDGTFVGGDLGMAKGEDDEFEAKITGAKRGVWLMSVESVEQGDDGGEDDTMGDDAKLIRFTWVSDGAVNYDSLPSRNSISAEAAGPDANWEVVGSFSVDSGTICLFSKHALDALLATGTDREAMLETLIDDDEGTKIFVPGGVVITGNDGGYEVEGRKDGEGRIVELRLRL
ncbi:hypothetical protein BV20DRAFT_870677 [Pilatotrama ljubarskyi]|nr:hypothetical protein BV20DRAFT_870677 [Pilatotrama ljubarskyi]